MRSDYGSEAEGEIDGASEVQGRRVSASASLGPRQVSPSGRCSQQGPLVGPPHSLSAAYTNLDSGTRVQVRAVPGLSPLQTGTDLKAQREKKEKKKRVQAVLSPSF